ncbi:GMC family oxidoreductase N-terminal domain-containing protein [Archangium gephyra]|uniref:GMC family oxidoreductase N-terminal domain-containing protein n=1 Tax=Archangium gephyra TaxID=48 RepID=UPI003B7F65BC
MDKPEGQLGSRTGLYRLHVDEDINVLVGCGLGGTSLINAGVSLRPDPRLFEEPCWPAALRAEGMTRLERGFSLAERMLGATPYPDTHPALPKLAALRKSAEALGRKFSKPPLAITFQDGVNEAGVTQKACNLCGDCCSGCNPGAKNTLLMNYLPDAKRHGAALHLRGRAFHRAGRGRPLAGALPGAGDGPRGLRGAHAVRQRGPGHPRGGHARLDGASSCAPRREG